MGQVKWKCPKEDCDYEVYSTQVKALRSVARFHLNDKHLGGNQSNIPLKLINEGFENVKDKRGD